MTASAGETDPLRVAQEVVDAARIQLPPGLAVELVSDAPPAVGAEPEQVKQVLVNLVENAIKYSPDGGRIEVALVAAADHVRFTVRDEGLGLLLGSAFCGGWKWSPHP